MNSLLLAFMTGLTTGGLSCLAVQGGLLASSLAQKEEQEFADRANRVSKWRLVAMFLIAKLVAYTMLGFLLGSLGSFLVLSPKTLGAMQIGVGLFMLATAARLLDLHPVFRYLVIAPPRFIYRYTRNQSKNGSYFAPAVMGFLTVFMPCGVTQVMMAVALATGSPVLGAATMAAFTVGTSPVFFALGAVTAQLLQKKVFAYAAALLIIGFGLLSINGGLVIRGSLYTFQNFYRAATTDVLSVSSDVVSGEAPLVNGKQDVVIDVGSRGYTTAIQAVKAGVPVRMTLRTQKTRGCSRAFTIPDYNIVKVLPETGEEVIEFTPMKTGRLAYACSMGMYSGSLDVIP